MVTPFRMGVAPVRLRSRGVDQLISKTSPPLRRETLKPFQVTEAMPQPELNMQTSHTLSRRGFIGSTSLAWAAAYFGPGAALAGEPDGGLVQLSRKAGLAATINVRPIRGNVSVLEGSGGNIAVLYGPDGKLLVDSGLSKTNVSAALNGIGRGPVRYVVNSHWHYDHTDGNAWLSAAGATIVAHENTRKRMSIATRVEAWD